MEREIFTTKLILLKMSGEKVLLKFHNERGFL
jgi:hypothetical protein